MAKSLAGRTLTAVRNHDLVHAGQRIGVAVSGGADSVALLRLLLEVEKELGVVLSVVHLNHKLRGKASDSDEKFVAQFAAKYDLEFHVERANVAAKAKREKANLEDAARRARCDFFARLVAEKKVDRVAVAHTADDQAETVLAHILRGTGLAGLAGIYPETATVVRPLLHVRRAELRAYLRSEKQKWREDATNQDATRLRARIRKELLPVLERQFQPAVVDHLAALAGFAREDEQFLDALARQRCESLARRDPHGTRIAIADLFSPWPKPNFNTEYTEGAESRDVSETTNVRQTGRAMEYGNALAKRILRRLIEAAKVETIPGATQITAQHIAAVLELARYGESGKTLQLPGWADIRRDRNDFVFVQRTSTTSQEKRPAKRIPESNRSRNLASAPNSSVERVSYEHQIDFRNGTATLAVPQVHCVFRLRVIDWPANQGETRSSGTVLDRDRLRSPLVLRNWRPGDRLQPAGHQKAHKLKRLLNEKHVSLWEREGWPVVTSGGTLVWARGFPVADGYAPSEGTRQAISIAEEEA